MYNDSIVFNFKFVLSTYIRHVLRVKCYPLFELLSEENDLVSYTLINDGFEVHLHA